MVCSICGKKFEGYGNNPYPVIKGYGRECCDECNLKVVFPARLALILGTEEETEELIDEKF